MANIEEKVESLCSKIVQDLGYELYDVEYVKEGKDYFLRIYIDSEKGIDLNDCEKVSNSITDLLDKEDPIKEQYFLEISSPGIERLLRKDWQLKKFKGEIVEVKLFKKDDKGNKNYIGNLDDVTDDILKINIDGIVDIDRKNISQVKTVYTD